MDDARCIHACSATFTLIILLVFGFLNLQAFRPRMYRAYRIRLLRGEISYILCVTAVTSPNVDIVFTQFRKGVVSARHDTLRNHLKFSFILGRLWCTRVGLQDAVLNHVFFPRPRWFVMHGNSYRCISLFFLEIVLCAILVGHFRIVSTWSLSLPLCCMALGKSLLYLLAERSDSFVDSQRCLPSSNCKVKYYQIT